MKNLDQLKSRGDDAKDAVDKDLPSRVGSEDARQLTPVDHAGENEDVLAPMTEDGDDPAAKFLRGEEVTDADLAALKKKLDGGN